MENTHQDDVRVEAEASPAAASVVSQKKSDYMLPVSIVVAALLISGSIIYLVGSLNKNPAPVAGDPNGGVAVEAPTISDRDVILGDANAPVAIIEYGDYQCPFCVRFFEQTEPSIRDQYIKTGKVKMVFRGFQFLGPESVAAGEAAECSKDQNSFWSYHDALYMAESKDGQEHNGNLNRTLFMKIAADLKLDTKAFGQCLDTHKYAQQVQAITNDAGKVGVNSTPTIFVNDQKVVGAQPFDGTPSGNLNPIKPIIEAQLNK